MSETNWGFRAPVRCRANCRVFSPMRSLEVQVQVMPVFLAAVCFRPAVNMRTTAGLPPGTAHFPDTIILAAVNEVPLKHKVKQINKLMIYDSFNLYFCSSFNLFIFGLFFIPENL